MGFQTVLINAECAFARRRFSLGSVNLSLGSVTFSRRLVTYRPSGGKHAVPRAVNMPPLGR